MTGASEIRHFGSAWPDNGFLGRLGISYPIIQAPMAGATSVEMVIAVSASGGLGSLPCAMLTADQLRSQVAQIRSNTDRPFNLNFFCHTMPDTNAEALESWRRRLAPYYAELGVDPNMPAAGAIRMPFDTGICDVAVSLAPPVVSFHFGLPDPRLLDRIKAAGCLVLASATTVGEARWLEQHGADAVIAQGFEAGGHRGMFLSTDPTTQVGTFALVPQVSDAVSVPVIAAGGIADGRGIAAALVLGAAAVQIGTAYLFCPEAPISDPHRRALRSATDDATALTNVLTGRPARSIANRVVCEIGPMDASVPPFPLAANALQPLRQRAEVAGQGDFSPLWSGQAAALAGPPTDAAALTHRLADEAGQCLRRFAALLAH